MTQPSVMRCKTSPDLRWQASIDESHNLGSPIRREDDLPQYAVNGVCVADQHQMRQGKIMTVDDHRGRMEQQGSKVLAYVGNGNLLANFHFVCWQDGNLYRLAEERVFDEVYTCAVFWKDGQATFEEICFVEELGKVQVRRKLTDGTEDITEKVDFLTSGQSLVRAGQKISLDHISQLFYDRRHLVNPLCVRVNGATLFVPNAQLQHGLTRKALTEPIRVAREARVNGTLVPLSVEGWLTLSQRPDSLLLAEQFLKEHGILALSDTLSDLSVLLRVAQTMDDLLHRALDEAGYEIVEELMPLKEGHAYRLKQSRRKRALPAPQHAPRGRRCQGRLRRLCLRR